MKGQVVYKGEAVPNSLVIIRPRNNRSLNQIPEIITDEDGQFRFENIPNGEYEVNVMAYGFVWMYGQQPVVINIKDDENTEKVVIELKRGGAISGRVTDEKGRAVSEVDINMLRLDEHDQATRPGGSSCSKTDDRGIYRIYNIQAGRYMVSAGVSDVSSYHNLIKTYRPEQFYPNSSDRANANVIEITEGKEIEGINITLRPVKKRVDIYGHIIDAKTGSGIEGIYLSVGTIQKNVGITSGGASGYENKNGEFHLQSFTPGKYWIIPNDTKGQYYGEAVECDVGDVDVHDIEIKMHKGGTVTGKVIIEGTSDLEVTKLINKLIINSSIIHHDDSERSKSQWTKYFSHTASTDIDEKGNFTLKVVPLGNISLDLSYRQGGERFLIRRIEHQGRKVNRSMGLDIRSGENISNVLVVLSYPMLSIHGEIKVIGSESLPKDLKFFVSAQGLDGDKISGHGEIDSQGRFAINHLDNGEYEIGIDFYHNKNQAMTDQQKAIKGALNKSKQNVLVIQKNQPMILTIDLNQK